MRQDNMRQIEKPDYYIKVGIKNNKVINIDWREMNKYLEWTKFFIYEKTQIIKILKQTIEFMRKT